MDGILGENHKVIANYNNHISLNSANNFCENIIFLENINSRIYCRSYSLAQKMRRLEREGKKKSKRLHQTSIVYY